MPYAVTYRRDGARMHSNSQGQVTSIGTEGRFELSRQGPHDTQTALGKLAHLNGVIIAGIGQTADSHVAITNRFHLENAQFIGHCIKRLIQRLQKFKNLTGLACRAPRGKADDIGKEDGCFGKQIGNGFGLGRAGSKSLCDLIVGVVAVVFRCRLGSAAVAVAALERVAAT
jgi:hypothetical protein